MPTGTDKNAGLLKRPDTAFTTRGFISGFPALCAFRAITVIVGIDGMYRRRGCVPPNFILESIHLLGLDEIAAFEYSLVCMARTFHPLQGVVAIHRVQTSRNKRGLIVLLLSNKYI